MEITINIERRYNTYLHNYELWKFQIIHTALRSLPCIDVHNYSIYVHGYDVHVRSGAQLIVGGPMRFP